MSQTITPATKRIVKATAQFLNNKIETDAGLKKRMEDPEDGTLVLVDELVKHLTDAQGSLVVARELGGDLVGFVPRYEIPKDA